MTQTITQDAIKALDGHQLFEFIKLATTEKLARDEKTLATMNEERAALGLPPIGTTVKGKRGPKVKK